LIITCIFLLSENVLAQTTNADAATSSDYVSGITNGRARALMAGAVALICLILGWRAKARSARTGAMVSIALGLIGIVLSIVHLSTSAGAVFGSGSGKAGAIVALILSLIGMTFAWLALKKGNEKSSNGN
jgi:hypothetical protein